MGVLPQQTFGSASLKVAHQEVTNPTSLSVVLTAKITLANGTSPSSCTLTFSKAAALTSQQIPVPTTCIDSIADMTDAKVEWKAVGGSSGSNPTMTTHVDGAELSATYTGQSALQAKTQGTRIVWMYGPRDPKLPEIYIWGTVYAPTSRIELDLAGVSTTMARFGRGVVLDGLKVADLTSTSRYVAFSNAIGVPTTTTAYSSSSPGSAAHGSSGWSSSSTT